MGEWVKGEPYILEKIDKLPKVRDRRAVKSLGFAIPNATITERNGEVPTSRAIRTDAATGLVPLLISFATPPELQASMGFWSNRIGYFLYFPIDTIPIGGGDNSAESEFAVYQLVNFRNGNSTTATEMILSL